MGWTAGLLLMLSLAPTAAGAPTDRDASFGPPFRTIQHVTPAPGGGVLVAETDVSGEPPVLRHIRASGLVDERYPEPEIGEKDWHLLRLVSAGDEVFALSSNRAGRIVVSGWRASTGSPLWPRSAASLENTFYAARVTPIGLYLGGPDGIAALDRRTGQPLSSFGRFGIAPVDAGGGIAFAGDSLYALGETGVTVVDPRSGKATPFTEVAENAIGMITDAAGRVVVAELDGRLIRLARYGSDGVVEPGYAPVFDTRMEQTSTSLVLGEMQIVRAGDGVAVAYERVAFSPLSETYSAFGWAYVDSAGGLAAHHEDSSIGPQQPSLAVLADGRFVFATRDRLDVFEGVAGPLRPRLYASRSARVGAGRRFTIGAVSCPRACALTVDGGSRTTAPARVELPQGGATEVRMRLTRAARRRLERRRRLAVTLRLTAPGASPYASSTIKLRPVKLS